LGTLQPKYLTSDIEWNVDTFDISLDGRTIALVTNENGASVIRLLDTATGQPRPGPKLPLGVVGAIK
jgi:hypothetical protein